jgi:hypothetical protein
VADIATMEAANRYLTDTFVPQHNATFACLPRDPASAFVPLGAVDLDAILCHEETRVVGRGDTVSLERQILQIAAQPGRRSCSGLSVTVRRHLDGGFTITRGAQRLGRYDAAGQVQDATAPMNARAPIRPSHRRLRPPTAQRRPTPARLRKRSDHLSN